ncbi:MULTISPECIES: 1-deoxy-D-xylulose-5-phosphate synthase [unclassified Fusibacter]|uniref:1-deoxy-D-xylulose-5-phosphate synthase n=1 Tax=unclassified Fusibacter TaxID=2624464 RepID=UPI0010126607|nr:MULTISPECIES: 1-deoxy-D-xylulose-5-phosphate synthase [unclassified Fusibacter]MCK8058880.1 1-deoxy-D-xylulose-5-phosphate synthase [Fusibacter sp. A2]NPE21955.1 1-deoxy-D-xylulose-5-phosphate synthase [Fusibacter sp. A1]RXV61523.1 1-deoxy-D-xylulose-5-phosphate synthase [Fusibacter sp. A1]
MYHYLNKLTCPSDIKTLDRKELIALSVEIRDYILKSVAKNGGHLASNLGVVELTVAMHLSFDSPTDQFVFDVSHQAYVHKLLTGRFEGFKTLRQYDGMSGFTKRKESDHDIFEAGHASTSLSAAMGLAKARDIKGEKHEVVAVIGDGALTGGMAYEAMNHIGHDGTKLIIILNDNEMSISENVGGMTKYLTKVRTNPNYFKVKDEVHQLIGRLPAVGKPMIKSISKVKESLKQMIVPGMLFEELGLTYLGLVDGHDIDALKDMFQHARKVDGPVIIHVKTKKGKGYRYSEEKPDLFHGISAFDIKTGKALKTSSDKTFSSVFGESLVELANMDKRICAVTAAMPAGTGLNEFMSVHKERFFDVGIAEEHAVTFAAGLARNGMRPFFVVYSTFLQRGYDQMIHDVCIQKLPVTFCLDRAGLVGDDGETHHGVFDLSFMLSMPSLTIFAPTDANDLSKMLAESLNIDGPVAIRYPRGGAYEDASRAECDLSPFYQNEGDDFNLIAIGRMHHYAMDAVKLLKEYGLSGRLITPKTIKPLDLEGLISKMAVDKPIFTVEDNQIIGGFGSYLSLLLSSSKVKSNVYPLGMPDDFVTHGNVETLFNKLGIDAQGIAHYIKETLE